jgi:hypothetical protein
MEYIQYDLTLLGVGLTGQQHYPVMVTRTRVIVRYVFEHYVHGVSPGFSVRF